MKARSTSTVSAAAIFEAKLLGGILRHQQQQREGDRHDTGAGSDEAPQRSQPLPVCNESSYTNAKGAAKYLGISKATFFRRKAEGYFTPSPVTGKYHVDDLDRVARSLKSGGSACEALETANLKNFEPLENASTLAPGVSAQPLGALSYKIDGKND